MSDQSIRVVCFDLGGVVVRICRTFDEALRRAGLRHRADSITPTAALRELSDAYQRGAFSSDEYAQRMSSVLTGSLSPEEVLAVHDAVILDPYEDVEAIVAQLSEAKVLTAALSNINDRHWPAVRDLPAIRRMNHHLLSHELGAIKPDEATFAAVERTTRANPESILFFDDTLENIEAASRRGWRAVHIDHSGSTAQQMREALFAARVPI